MFFLYYLIFINIFGFILTVDDKIRARKKKWRIPEKNLFLAAILGGSVGVFSSMLLVRHKTKHISFMLGIPAILLIQVALIFYIK